MRHRGTRRRSGVVSRVFRFLGMVVLLAGIGMACYAGWRWLQTGQSDSAVIAEVVNPWLPAGTRGWLAKPNSWFGAHRLATWLVQIPVFALVTFLGFLLLLVSVGDRRDR